MKRIIKPPSGRRCFKQRAKNGSTRNFQEQAILLREWQQEEKGKEEEKVGRVRKMGQQRVAAARYAKISTSLLFPPELPVIIPLSFPCAIAAPPEK